MSIADSMDAQQTPTSSDRIPDQSIKDVRQELWSRHKRHGKFIQRSHIYSKATLRFKPNLREQLQDDRLLWVSPALDGKEEEENETTGHRVFLAYHKKHVAMEATKQVPRLKTAAFLINATQRYLERTGENVHKERIRPLQKTRDENATGLGSLAERYSNQPHPMEPILLHSPVLRRDWPLHRQCRTKVSAEVTDGFRCGCCESRERCWRLRGWGRKARGKNKGETSRRFEYLAPE
eukprot:TRINITY_DN13409_c0_g1_i1.p1 TRINITY_DN13409_c0_g1~~TRINITY_DN13409_c0_g1_i1.p1  ORF type:complete len:236 (-),score=22.80 TRINITY_DN13409_c0_g1_i1:445-1152(-)